jgi:hypothetical protein
LTERRFRDQSEYTGATKAMDIRRPLFTPMADFGGLGHPESIPRFGFSRQNPR